MQLFAKSCAKTLEKRILPSAVSIGLHRAFSRRLHMRYVPSRALPKNMFEMRARHSLISFLAFLVTRFRGRLFISLISNYS